MNLSDMTWPMVAGLDRNTPVVIPVAALEQHGHHLPVFTDSLLLGEVIRRLSIRFEREILFAPLQWFGNSAHHMDFPGSMSASPRTYLDLLNDLAGGFIAQGFKRIVFLNGHGGNDVPGKQAVFELRQQHRRRSDLLLLFGTYWLLASPAKPPVEGLHQSQMGHACEWETSMILRIRPDLVRMDLPKIPPVEFGNSFDPATRGWITQDRSAQGHIGYPHLATAEKGEALFAAFAGFAEGLLGRVLRWDGESWEG